MVIPSRPRRTSPCSISCAITARAMLTGTAKPMPMLPPVGPENRGVDADQLASRVDQRAARIAGVDRGVGLDEVLVAFDAETAAAKRADDPGGHRLAEAERIADRDHQVADLKASGVAERYGDEVRGIELEQRDVGFRVAADEARRIGATGP